MWGPVLGDSLVRLRPIEERELPLLVEWSGDRDVLRFAGIAYETMAPGGFQGSHHAMAPAEVRRWWESAGTDPDAFHWGLEWQGRLVGRTGIHFIDWQARLGWASIMLGDKAVWRHGIASAAVELRTEFAFRQLNLHKLNSAHFDGDPGGGGVRRRSGYREIARLREQLYRDGRWFDEIRTELMREDWERTHPLM